jgi:hypothetical protein
MRRVVLIPILAAALCPAQSQKYTGPRPEKPDLPYLLHAASLLPLDAANAREESRKDATAFIVEGAASATRTPMAEPIFLIRTEKILPDKLELYKFEVRNGKREVVFSQKKRKDGTRPILVTASRVSEGIYRVEVQRFLENGEYALTPSGSNQVFCFQVY